MAGDFELIVSEKLLLELQRTLGYPRVRARIPAGDGESFVELIRGTAEVVADPPDPRAICTDPHDDYLPALAGAASAVLVTGDRHLLDLGGTRPVMPARQFLGLLPAALDPDDPGTTTRIVLVQGDITDQTVDAVVNAANPSLLGGGGVDGAIHRRGGPAILEECRALRASRYVEGLPAGQAVATTAGNLAARWVIHTVGPVHSRSQDRSDLLASCHREALRVADELGAETVAFPAISTGVYGWPVDDAARIAIGTVSSTPTRVREVRFVLFDGEAHQAFLRAVDGHPGDM